MKKLISSASALLLTVGLFANGPAKENYTVKNNISSLEWTGEKVTGSHEGTIEVKEGNIVVNNGNITSGTLIIDMNSIVVTDIEDAEMNGKLKGHLQSDDFFGVEAHPTSTLKINKVEKKEGDQYTIFADLTIKGHTEKVEIPATIKMDGNKLVAIGETEIDRTKFGIRYGSGSFFDNLGDKTIYDNFKVKFKVGAMK
jgi:polyisoprenoid-binding protein YceI